MTRYCSFLTDSGRRGILRRSGDAACRRRHSRRGRRVKVRTWGMLTTAAAMALTPFVANGSALAGSEQTLSFTTWASESELAAFTALIDQFESEHDGVT